MCFSLKHLDHIVQAYIYFYNEHRPHQGIGNRRLQLAGEPLKYTDQTNPKLGHLECVEQLGGLLKSYRRVA